MRSRSDKWYSAFDMEMVTLDTTAGGVGLTAAKYHPASGGGAVMALLTFETDQSRIRIDGGDPLDALELGHVREAGQEFWLESEDQIAGFRGNQSGTAASAIIVTYYR